MTDSSVEIPEKEGTGSALADILIVLAPADNDLTTLTALFAGLPPDLHTPVVLATEDNPARYAAALNARPVQQVTERATFAPKHVYCTPLLAL